MSEPLVDPNGTEMIHCPACGTANRDRSKFCDECGEKLAVRASEPGDVPAWVSELESTLRTRTEGDDDSGIQDHLEVPDWFQDPQITLPDTPVEGAFELGDAENEHVPDWLAAAQRVQARVKPPRGVAEPSPAEPEGLQVAGESVQAEDKVVRAEADTLQAEAEPMQVEPEPRNTGPSQSTSQDQPPGREHPAWLQELGNTEEETRPAHLTPEDHDAEVHVPAWPVETQPAAEEGEPESRTPEKGTREPPPESPVAPNPVAQHPEEGGSADRTSDADHGQALRLRTLREAEEKLKDGAPVAEESAFAGELLRDLQDTLPVELPITQSQGTAAPARDVAIPARAASQARLFAEIVAQPPQVAPYATAQSRSGPLSRPTRYVIYLALIAVATLPLLLRDPLLPRTIKPAPAVVDLYEAIESLDPDGVVLVAFDYDPSTSGEMDVLAEAIIGHLMDRKTRVVAVSLLPAGPATAQRLLDVLTMDRSGYESAYGQRYANLGFIPGQAAAVRLLGEWVEAALPHDFQGSPLEDLEVMDGVSSIQDFDLIVDLAAGQDTLRWWIEQAGTPYGVLLGAGVSASVEPLARPYYETESQQLIGMIGGVPGAAEYETLRNDQDHAPGAASARLESQFAGQMLLILILLVGIGVVLVRRWTGRER